MVLFTMSVFTFDLSPQGILINHRFVSALGSNAGLPLVVVARSVSVVG